MKKLTLILLTATVLAVLPVALTAKSIWDVALSFRKPVAEAYDPTRKLVNPSNLEFDWQECAVSDSISFDEYQENAQFGDVQENIGYINNKFGLYVYSEGGFLKAADELVNSNGGDWGYVLIPYNVKDYDKDKWEEIFEMLGKKHLIPIMQLWDVTLEDYKNETEDAAKFLNRFPWPIRKKYVSVYNEVNDSRFWKSSLDPAGYAEVLDFTIKTFKSLDENFFMLNAAFNSTAPSSNGYMDEHEYLKKMDDKIPGIFGQLDGWASHPYPQPAYMGRPSDTGRDSIRAYEWELDILQKDFGVNKLPVFITETGWPHAEGESYNPSYYSADVVADYIKQAYENVWLKDDRVVAVTPFTVFYDAPFDHFSWVSKTGAKYKQFDVIKKMKKTAGRPPVLKKVEKEIMTCE